VIVRGVRQVFDERCFFFAIINVQSPFFALIVAVKCITFSNLCRAGERRWAVVAIGVILSRFWMFVMYHRGSLMLWSIAWWCDRICPTCEPFLFFFY